MPVRRGQSIVADALFLSAEFQNRSELTICQGSLSLVRTEILRFSTRDKGTGIARAEILEAQRPRAVDSAALCQYIGRIVWCRTWYRRNNFGWGNLSTCCSVLHQVQQRLPALDGDFYHGSEWKLTKEGRPRHIVTFVLDVIKMARISYRLA
jgi:hypothetical protein